MQQKLWKCFSAAGKFTLAQNRSIKSAHFYLPKLAPYYRVWKKSKILEKNALSKESFLNEIKLKTAFFGKHLSTTIMLKLECSLHTTHIPLILSLLLTTAFQRCQDKEICVIFTYSRKGKYGSQNQAESTYTMAQLFPIRWCTSITLWILCKEFVTWHYWLKNRKLYTSTLPVLQVTYTIEHTQ